MFSESTKLKVQRFGRFLSNMVMPNIGAFIAWGLITALFIESGWLPVPALGGFSDNAALHNAVVRFIQDSCGGFVNYSQSSAAFLHTLATFDQYAGKGIVGPMITYLLPLLIGYTGGKIVGGDRGAVVGAITTMGVIVGTDIPMFLGAMIVGPLGGWSIKKFDQAVEGKIKSGFEMLVNNFSAGIIGMLLALLAFVVIGPAVKGLSAALAAGVDFLVKHDLLPLTSIFVEPAKILFLNNAINHGIFSPLGIAQSQEVGRSIFFLIEANPGPGLGVLLAYMLLGKGSAKQTAGGAAIIHFFGGIHEICADESASAAGSDCGRHDRRLHPRLYARRSDFSRLSGLDFRRAGDDAQRRLCRGALCGRRQLRGVVPCCQRFCAPHARLR